MFLGSFSFVMGITEWIWWDKQLDHVFLYYSPLMTADLFLVFQVYLFRKEKRLVHTCNFSNILHLLHMY